MSDDWSARHNLRLREFLADCPAKVLRMIGQGQIKPNAFSPEELDRARSKSLLGRARNAARKLLKGNGDLTFLLRQVQSAVSLGFTCQEIHKDVESIDVLKKAYQLSLKSRHSRRG